MISFDIGRSALSAAQQSTNIIGQNHRRTQTTRTTIVSRGSFSSAPRIGIGTCYSGPGVDVARYQPFRKQPRRQAAITDNLRLGGHSRNSKIPETGSDCLGQGDGSLATT